ncbi:MAG: hypothetical protein GF317_22445 [Candidatus Lokiarchaeota archaeon]|nr:hypothetical protein [Candidatus Lokiarchaeota archaeon]MBD3202221.1 hypothetical protein [Candidatus Lokiarchaeota archaeon]
MPICYHCGTQVNQVFKCDKCGQEYCQFHRNPVDHECNIVRESLNFSSTPSYNQIQSSRNQLPSDQQQYGTIQSGYDGNAISSYQSSNANVQGTTDGTFTWYRRENYVPENAFDSESGIEFKGILFPYKSEILHLLVGSILIYVIGLIGFYSPQNQSILNNLGYGWIIFMVAGFYTTAFLFHEFGHRQVAIHFGFQTKFRLLKYGMIITAFGLLTGLVSLITNTPALPSLALPGAVVVLGLDEINRETGLCKAAGPTINLVYGIILLLISFLIPIFPINYFIGIAASLNFMLGAFNLIPIGILDGQNIFKWNKVVYLILAISMVGLLIFNYYIIYLPPESNPYYVYILP